MGIAKPKANKLKKITVLTIAVCSLTCALFPFGLNKVLLGKASNSIEIKQLLSTENIGLTAPIDGYDDLVELTVSGASGETEGAQFVIKSSSDIKNYNLTVTNLTNGEAVISSENVNCYKQIYSYCNDKLPLAGTFPSGYYPDALIPIEHIVRVNENNVKANENQAFWVDVEIPSNAEAGVYMGTLTLSYNGTSNNIPISVTVYDFTINEVPSAFSMLLIWQDWLLDSDFDNTDATYKKYFDFLLKYNSVGYDLPGKINPQSYAKSVKEYYPKVKQYGLPYSYYSRTSNNWDYYVDYMVEIGRQGKTDGINYFDKMYYYFDVFYDEADAFDWRWDQVEEILRTTDEAEEIVIECLVEEGALDSITCEAAETIRNIKHMMTVGDIDNYEEKGLWELDYMFIPDYKNFHTTVDREKHAKYIEQGIDLYSYGHGLYNYPCGGWGVDDYVVTRRDVFWNHYDEGLLGEMMWCINGHQAFSDATGFNWDPLFTNIFTVATRENNSNGDGYGMYSGRTYETDELFPTLRLTAQRDGVDDYTYMDMLEQRYLNLSSNYGATDLSASKIIAFLNEQVTTLGRSKLNFDGVLRARDNLASLIVMADKFGLAITDATYCDDGIELELYANAGVTLKVNGQDISGVSANSGVKYVKKVAYNDRALTVSCADGSNSMSVTMDTFVEPTLINGFENQTDLEKVSVYERFDSQKSTNTNSQYIYSGEGSLKAILSGYKNFVNLETVSTYMPQVSFDLANYGIGGLDELDYLYFYVYNAGTERIYDVYITALENGMPVEKKYDSLKLKANTWTKILLSDWNIFSMDKSTYENVTSISLRTANLINGQNVYTQTIYVDGVYVGRAR